MASPSLTLSNPQKPFGSGSNLFRIASSFNLAALDGEGPFSQQKKDVHFALLQEATFNNQVINAEVNWFYTKLGFNEYYFESTPTDIIAKHILSILAAKILAKVSGSEFDIDLRQEQENSGLFVVRSKPGQRVGPCSEIEKYIDQKYFTSHTYDDENDKVLATSSSADDSWRVQCFRSSPMDETEQAYIRLYFLTKSTFADEDVKQDETDLRKIADRQFLAKATPHILNIFEEVISAAVDRLGPVIHTGRSKRNELRLLVAYRKGTTHSYFSSFPHVYHSHNLFATRKYTEHFKNGIVVNAYYLGQRDPTEIVNLDSLIDDASLLYVLPRTSLTPLFRDGHLNMQETAYAYAAWKMAHAMLNRTGPEFAAISSAVKDPNLRASLNRLKHFLRSNVYSERVLLQVLMGKSELLKLCYNDFQEHHNPSGKRLPLDSDIESLRKFIISSCDEAATDIFLCILKFNRLVLKTNFYCSRKVALSFRLLPDILDSTEYPTKPFGVFFIVGSEFRGFHLRFADVARGGIRVIRSAYVQAYERNLVTMLAENYNLAWTQQLKNKDIPEGGSKGTILLHYMHQDKMEAAFRKYVDALMDLILLPNTQIVDHYGKEEMLFLGPDENTANVMDWAALHARARGYKYWKGFTTGKSTSMGGVPHDLYGMTTHSVQQYVLGIQEKEKLIGSECTKFQTGGPDGDLGSNSIKMANDITIGLVDAAGVLCDPDGLNQQELVRLATSRVPCGNFNQSLLGPRGFFISVSDVNKTLPSGEVVTSGLIFRNDFHLHPLSSATFFVPCGGRPEAVNVSNVDRLFDSKGQPRFKYIVEGANLFFTQEARGILEDAGVILFKDASANKGGVTSSSKEVLAALALNDDEFNEHMTVKNGVTPSFYSSYVADIQQVIDENARLEFECIDAAARSSGKRRSDLTDVISAKMNELFSSLETSELVEDHALMRRIMKKFLPPSLVKLVGLDEIMKRLPSSYVKAAFSSYVASRYVYTHGYKTQETTFLKFISNIMKEGGHE